MSADGDIDDVVMTDNNETSVVVPTEDEEMDITSAYQALIKEYNSRNTPAGSLINTEAMNNAIAALEALLKPLANDMINNPGPYKLETSGGKYRRTRRTRRTRRSRRHRKAKRSRKTRM
jgi:hypothetical protein